VLVSAACAAALAGALWLLLAPERGASPARRGLAAALILLLAWVALGWTRSELRYADALPAEFSPEKILLLTALQLILSTAAFAAAGGRGSAQRGAAYGFATAAVGFCASRWPQLARAIELGGGIFAGPFLAAALPAAFALTAAGLAAALLLADFRPHASLLVLGLAAAWAAPTLGVEAALSRWWGFGPRSLAEAAGIPTNDDAPRLTVVRLSGSERPPFREPVRMAAEGVDLSPESLGRLDDFLRRSGYRGIFASEALKDLRQGWRQWWETDRALDAMMISKPGRVHPDYRGALDLLRAGPLTPERYAKLQRLDAFSRASTAGFEDVDGSQYIFEGFSAAYARFGNEALARQWLYRIDNLWPINERKVEITPVEDFRDGRVTGRVLLDGLPALGVRVGLFYVSTSSGTGVTTRLLSSAAFPEDDGGFSFDELGPGTYELALLGRRLDLGGRILGAPGPVVLGYERPTAVLPPIRLERDVLPVPEAFAPGGLPEAPTPQVPEKPLGFPGR